MSKKFSWGSKLDQVNQEIGLIRDLVAMKEREAAKIKQIIASENQDVLAPEDEDEVDGDDDADEMNIPPSYSQARIGGNASEEEVAEVEKPRRKPGRPLGSKNKPKEQVVAAANSSEKPHRKPGRPFGSKNKPKFVNTISASNEVDAGEEDFERLELLLGKIGQKINRPIKLEDFVRVLRKNQFDYSSKTVRLCLRNLVKIGKFVQIDDEDRSYEYVDENSVIAF